MKNSRPKDGDCAPYFMRYINLAEGNDILQSLNSSFDSTMNFLLSIPADKWDYAYAEDKWTIKDLMIHIIDTERIFMNRALRISRNDKAKLPGYNQDDYVPYTNASNRSAESIIEEYESVRKASITLYKNMTDEMWQRLGIASDNSITVLAIAYIVMGHQIHHFRVLEERYL